MKKKPVSEKQILEEQVVEKASEEQLIDFMKLIEGKNIDLEDIKYYLKDNKLPNDLRKLSLEEFNKLHSIINVPDITVGERVSTTSEYKNFFNSKGFVDAIVLDVNNNKNSTGKLLLIGIRNRIIAQTKKDKPENIEITEIPEKTKVLGYHSEFWINKCNPFVKKYSISKKINIFR